MIKNIFLFTDLDDTLWQTKRKIENFHPNLKQVTSSLTHPSFMREDQELFSELFLNHPDISVIPITARELNQYKRTYLYNDERVKLAVIYFSGMILYENRVDEEWQKIINHKYAKLKFQLTKLQKLIKNHIKVKWDEFKFVNVDDFYLNIKYIDRNTYKEPIKYVYEILKEMELDGFSINSNDNNIAILPEFLNKELAINYIIDKYKPRLTLGAGDSLSDLGFMQKSNYLIIPQKSQINEKLNNF